MPNVLCSVSTRGRTHTTLPMALQAIINQTQKPDKLVIFDDNDDPQDLRSDPLYQQLFYMLQALVRDELAFSRTMFKDMDKRIEIEQKLFEDKAKGVGIFQFADFYASNAFKAKFALESAAKKIVCL